MSTDATSREGSAAEAARQHKGDAMSRLQLLTVYAFALRVAGHTYIVRWTAETRHEAAACLANWARDSSFRFSWRDAAVMYQELRKTDKGWP